MQHARRTHRAGIWPSRRTLYLCSLLVAILVTIDRCCERYRLGRDLGAAVSQGDSQRVGKLLRAGADPHSRGPLELPVLCWAAGATGPSNEAIVCALLEAGADPNLREPTCLRTPLMFAATTENSTLAALLIAKGAEVNAVGLNDDCALEYAEVYGREEAARLLVRHGAICSDELTAR